MTEPVTELTLEAPGGLVTVRAECRNGKAERIFVQNLPSFAARLDVPLEVEGLGRLTVDTAYGGDSFVVVNAAAMGFSLEAHEAHDIARLGVRITNAANAAIRFEHPENPDWQHFSFCLCRASHPRRDRSARRGGGGDPARQGGPFAHWHRTLRADGPAARAGEMGLEDSLTTVSLIGSTFTGRILGETRVGDHPAILPELSGRGWVTGIHQHMLDPDDPWPGGYRLSDTWGHAVRRPSLSTPDPPARAGSGRGVDMRRATAAPPRREAAVLG